MIFKPDQTLLFIGDSITDCGREYQTPAHLGYGYVRTIASALWAKYPELHLKIINKGISGNTSTDLRARWEQDCIALKPDVLSLFIGINDTWRRFDSNQITTRETYLDNCTAMLSRVREALPDTRILILEPFLLPHPADRLDWEEDFEGKRTAARKLADLFADDFIPLNSLFRAKAALGGFDLFAPDGVHPTDTGAALIAQEFLAVVEGH